MFTQYTPKEAHSNVIYLQDEDGRDWYDVQKGFKEATIKIVVNQAGEVISSSTDASMLFPINAEVFEVKSLPKDSSRLYYIKGKIKKYEDMPEHKADVKRSDIKDRLAVLKDKIDTLRVEREYLELSVEKTDQLKAAAKEYVELKSQLDKLAGKDNGE